MRARNLARGTVLVALLWTIVAAAQEQVGSVAALEGRAEALHTGRVDWAALAPGSAVLLGDQLRTLADSRLKVLLRDDSVVTLAASSALTVDEQVAAPAPTSRVSLVAGTVRAVVTERYKQPGARFEMETPTAIAGVRGTGFIAAYDAAADETLVAGLYDTTFVRSRIDPKGRREVEVAAGYATRVRRGSYPTSPTLLPEDALRGLAARTELPAGGTSAAEELKMPAGVPAAGPAVPQNPRERALQPEEQAVDQPVEQLRRRGIETQPSPPPPPVPPKR